jgi:hypothetical protein
MISFPEIEWSRFLVIIKPTKNKVDVRIKDIKNSK